MNKCKFKSITTDHIPAMTNLLIERQSLESKVYPFLKNSCLNVKYVTEMFEELFDDSKIVGIGAFANEELVGYLIAEIENDTRRGRCAWVPYEGIAIRKDQSSELIRKLYAEVSALWLEQGCFNQYTLVPLGNQEYFDAFMNLSFSIQQVHAVMNMEDYKPFESVADIDIRLANEADSEAMGRMSKIIQYYQGSAPTFELVLPEFVTKIKSGYEGIVQDEDSTVLIATKDLKEVGFQVYGTIDSDLMTPDNGAELSIAGTYTSEMGSGIGKSLMNEGYKLMKEKEYDNIVIDWRVTNLASSTFWPKCGFKPIAYRMFRAIDNNIAWANPCNPSINQL